MTDSIHEYANSLSGLPPDNLKELITTAERVYAGSGLDDGGEHSHDVFLICAAASLGMMTGRVNRAEFVARAQQVARWLEIPRVGTSRELLDNKIVELTRVVGQRLFASEGFVLMLFNVGDDQQTTADGGSFLAHASTVDRRTLIKLLEEHLIKMKAEQDQQS
jgi:hypothetical protein